MPRFIERPVAGRELEDLGLRIALKNHRAALRFVDGIRASYTTLAEMPLAGTAWPTSNPRLAGLRYWVPPRYRNYVIFYRPIADGVEILHVLHGAQDLEAVLGEQE